MQKPILRDLNSAELIYDLNMFKAGSSSLLAGILVNYKLSKNGMAFENYTNSKILCDSPIFKSKISLTDLQYSLNQVPPYQPEQRDIA